MWMPRSTAPLTAAVQFVLDPLELELGDQGQDPNREASHRGRAIEVVLDRNKPRARLVQASDRAQGIDRRAGEAIEFGNHDPTRLACLAAGKRLLEERALELGPRLIDLFPQARISTSCSFAQSAIFFRWSSGEMNDSPSRPARRLTRM
jgi:hypothetical protein